MSNKKKFSFAIPFVLIFTVLYLIFAARPMGNDYQLEPEWTINIATPVTESDSEEIFPFKLGKTIGYFDDNGRITHVKRNFEKSSISENYYSTYKTDASQTPFFDSQGNQCGIIVESGFPFFSKDQIYVFLPGGASFSKCDSEGNSIWTYEGVTPITAFSSKQNFTAVGLADGVIKIFDNKTGALNLEYSPGGSDFPVILGLDISDDGNYIASVSGQAQQRFVLVKKENTQVKVLAHEFLPTGMTSQSLVKFLCDGKTVIYNYNRGLGVAEINTGRTHHQKMDSQLISWAEGSDLTWLMGKKGNVYTVCYLKENKDIGGSFSFEAENAFIQAWQNNIYIGKNTNISKIKVTKK